MLQTHADFYRAFAGKDPRFDGQFFVGVTSTGIYCRPVCPSRLPKESNCKFFEKAEEARGAGFRACKRCRPELIAGDAPMDDAQRIAELFVERIENGLLDVGAGVEDIAKHFDLSSRQISRIIRKELGVSPAAYLKNRRLNLSRKLLKETSLPVTGIAFQSGFSSLRRFNDAFVKSFGISPTQFRKKS